MEKILISKILCQMTNIKGGIYSDLIKKFFSDIIKSYTNKDIYNLEDINKLGGLYFIEGDFRTILGEYYKIGMSSSLSKYKLLSRINSYGTYYPFGIKLRGITFLLKTKNINYNAALIISIINELDSFHSSDKKEEIIKKYKKKEKEVEELEENESLTDFVDKIKYEYMVKAKDEKQINYNILDKYILDMEIKSMEEVLQYNIKKNIPTSKKFLSNVVSRKNFGEFYKLSCKELLKIYLDTAKNTNLLLIYFPDKPLLFGEYAQPEKIPKYEIYLGNKKII
jgi:hypothetical protein